MYPIDSFTADSPHKIEAIKYYVDLNKAYLKEVSKEEYEVFSEYMKGAGKDLLVQIVHAPCDADMEELLNKLDKALPYGAKLSSISGLENKVAAMHKEFAKLYMRSDIIPSSRKEALKKQREIAGRYDDLTKTLNTYRDAVSNLDYVKTVARDKRIMQNVYSKVGGEKTFEEFAHEFRELADKALEDVKKLRADAFTKIREFGINEMMLVLEHDVTPSSGK